MKNNLTVLFFATIYFSPLFWGEAGGEVAAQNLVPNPSFEDTVSHNGICIGPINYAEGWFNPNAATTDFYTYIPQSTNCLVSSWNNPSGYQMPRTGNSYLGFYAANSGGGITREYAAILLDSMLSYGCKYYIEFYVSRANKFGGATDRIGCAFTNDTSGYYLTSGVLPLIPAIESPLGVLITDSMNWQKISGTYIATGNEQYLLIGNFHDLNNTLFVIVDSTVLNLHAYYYLEDVTVLSCDSTLSLSQSNLDLNATTLFPNPASEYFAITSLKNQEILTVELINQAGIQIKKQKWKQIGTNYFFDISLEPSGSYLLNITMKNNTKFSKSLIIKH